MSLDSLVCRPIGFIRSGKNVKFKARHQPDESCAEQNVLELERGPGVREAIRDLEGMERIWLIWWFHQAESWRPLVLPPRGPPQRRGLYSTRSPHRPNPIGLTPVQLLGVTGLTLLLGPCDLTEGTPVFDIKPYFPAYDSFPVSAAGWIDAVDALMSQPPKFSVLCTPYAEIQIQWLKDEWSVDFRDRMITLLSQDPSPHKTRRINRRSDGNYDIGCGGWRAIFTVSDMQVSILAVQPSFPLRFLQEEWRTSVPDREAQLAFLDRWPDGAEASMGPSLGTCSG